MIDDVIDAKEAAKMLRVNPRTVIRLAERGEMPAFRVGDLWRFQRSDVETYIEDQKRKQQQRQE